MTQMWLTVCGTLHVENPRSSSSTKLWTSTSKVQKYGIHVSMKGIEKIEELHWLLNDPDWAMVHTRREQQTLQSIGTCFVSRFPAHQPNQQRLMIFNPSPHPNKQHHVILYTYFSYVHTVCGEKLPLSCAESDQHAWHWHWQQFYSKYMLLSFLSPHLYCTHLTDLPCGGSVYWIRQCLPGELWLRVPVRVDVSHGSWQHAAATCRVRMCRASPVDLTCPCQSRELFVKWFVHDVCEADSVMPIKATLINSNYCIHTKYATNHELHNDAKFYSTVNALLGSENWWMILRITKNVEGL